MSRIIIPNLTNVDEYMIWAESSIKQGISRQDLCSSILTRDYFNDSSLVLSEVERYLSSIMVDRNLIGQQWEKENQIGLAIKAYEMNISDKFIGAFPYDRLRIIYNKYDFLDEVIRVCQAFISLPGSPSIDRQYNKKTRFLEQIDKLSRTTRINKKFEKSKFLFNNIEGSYEIDEFFIKGEKISGNKGKAKYRNKNGKEITIEKLVLESLGSQGYQGFWTENNYWWMIMSLLFWDVIFKQIPGMFFHQSQDMPLDFFEIDFYIRRAKEINQRLSEINKTNVFGKKESVNILKNNFRKHKNTPCRPIENWNLFSLDGLLFTLESITPNQLSKIMERLLLYFNEYRRGLPDLFIVKDNNPLFIECKSEDEDISIWQKSWHMFLREEVGIPVKVCRVESSKYS